MLSSGVSPSRVRGALMPGSASFDILPNTRRPSSLSQRRSMKPAAGRRPGSNGGTPGAGRGVKYGWNDAHGRPEASAAACAPHEFVSTRSTSGLVPVMVLCRSSTRSWPGRRTSSSLTRAPASGSELSNRQALASRSQRRRALPAARDFMAKHLRNDPRVPITVHESSPPWRGIEIRTIAQFVDADSREADQRMAARYLGPRETAACAAANHGPQLVVRLAPGEIRAWDFADNPLA
jgi:hypothetical protein